MPTGREIARLAGVSQATVSRVARNDPSVSASLRERVLQVLADTGYRPDALARSMRTGQTGVVGFATPDLRDVDTRLLAAFEQEAARRNLGLLVWSFGAGRDKDPPEPPRMAEGLFLAHPDTTQLAVTLRVPAVLINVAGHSDGHDIVSGDDETSGYEIAGYFANAGRLRVGVVGPGAAGPSTAGCVEGFRRGVAVHDLHLPKARVLNLGGEDNAAPTAVAALLRSPALPQAVLCTDERSARCIVEAAREAGLQIPGDLWVVAFTSSSSAMTGLLGLTTVHPRLDRLAEAAFDALQHRLRDPDRPAQRKVVANDIVLSASTSFTPLA